MRSDNLYSKRKFLTVCSIVCHEIWLDSTYLNFQTGLCTYKECHISTPKIKHLNKLKTIIKTKMIEYDKLRN